jgi:hypothetical protein
MSDRKKKFSPALHNIDKKTPTFLISVKNMNLLSSSIYKHLKTYLIKHNQSLILRECGSQLISVMSDRKKRFSPTLRNIYKKHHGA